MYKLTATVKCPIALKDELTDKFHSCGIENITEEIVNYHKFISESRLYFDFVFMEMLSDEKDVAYLHFEFEDSEQGRTLAHDVELKVGWIPLNLRYRTIA